MLSLRAIILTAALGTSYAAQTNANVAIKFVESAPKDWFSLTNTGTCTFEQLTMQVDLSQTAGKLIFDTTSTGAGVEVFQPFEVRQGNIQLISTKGVLDGDTHLTVSIKNLEPGESASFTIDVDDTLPKSELGMIRVSDSEMSGGRINIENPKDSTTYSGTFDTSGVITLPVAGCAE